MERYCIKDNWQGIEGRVEAVSNRFVLLERMVDSGYLPRPFPECEEEIHSISQMLMDDKVRDGNEDEMYGWILTLTDDMNLIDLDIYLHTYYTLLYEKKKNTYIPLVGHEWEKEKKEMIRKKRKECRRAKNGKEAPFVVKEGDNVRESDQGKKSYKETEIQDFAPNLVRLYYLSDGFWKLFKYVKGSNASKYSYMSIKGIFEDDVVKASRVEEKWLVERLIGANLAWSCYSFFSAVFENMEFKTVEEYYKNSIQNIIREIMLWEGVYSRNGLIARLKTIYELKFGLNKGAPDVSPEVALEYLYENVLRNRMGIIAGAYKNKEICVYNAFKNGDNLGELEEKCNGLLKKCIKESEGYPILSSVDGVIDWFMALKECKCREKEYAFKEKLYKMIQQIIIDEQQA